MFHQTWQPHLKWPREVPDGRLAPRSPAKASACKQVEWLDTLSDALVYKLPILANSHPHPCPRESSSTGFRPSVFGRF
jgi:hypothetical protein